MKFTSKIVINKRAGEKGKSLLFLQCFVNGSRSRISLGFTIEPNFFNPKTGLITEDCPDASDHNLVLRSKMSKANDIAKKYRLREEMTGEDLLTKELFEKEFKRTGNSKNDFLVFYEERLKYRKEKEIIEYNTGRNEQTTLNKLKLFKKVIKFSSINEKLIDEINLWMIKRGNIQNTRWCLFKHMHSYLEVAIKEGLYIGNPFVSLNCPLIEGPIVFLEKEELAELIKYYYGREIPLNQKAVLKYFLFACFTGLRISDIVNIKFENRIGDVLVFVAMKNKKKGKIIRLPLNKRAKEFMDAENFKGEETENIFDTVEDQTTNDILKLIATACAINKRITFHVARHSFATLYLELGGQVQVLQKYLGHAKIQTTMRYVHVTDRVKTNEMKRFNKM